MQETTQTYAGAPISGLRSLRMLRNYAWVLASLLFWVLCIFSSAYVPYPWAQILIAALGAALALLYRRYPGGLGIRQFLLLMLLPSMFCGIWSVTVSYPSLYPKVFPWMWTIGALSIWVFAAAPVRPVRIGLWALCLLLLSLAYLQVAYLNSMHPRARAVPALDFAQAGLGPDAGAGPYWIWVTPAIWIRDERADETEAMLRALPEALKDRHLLMAIPHWDEAEKWQRFHQNYLPHVPAYFDADSSWTRMLDPLGAPYGLLICDGKVIYGHSGMPESPRLLGWHLRRLLKKHCPKQE